MATEVIWLPLAELPPAGGRLGADLPLPDGKALPSGTVVDPALAARLLQQGVSRIPLARDDRRPSEPQADVLRQSLAKRFVGNNRATRELLDVIVAYRSERQESP